MVKNKAKQKNKHREKKRYVERPKTKSKKKRKQNVNKSVKGEDGQLTELILRIVYKFIGSFIK